VLLLTVLPATAETPRAMVVTAQHLATDAGVEILKAGGNAVDAAVAVGYAEAVVNPCCGNIGGGGFMLLHLRRHGDVVINFRETAPAALKSCCPVADASLAGDAPTNRYWLSDTAASATCTGPQDNGGPRDTVTVAPTAASHAALRASIAAGMRDVVIRPSPSQARTETAAQARGWAQRSRTPACC